MVSIRLEGTPAPYRLPLGSVCRFLVTGADDVAWQAFVRYESVVYTAAVASGRGEGAIRVFPESPGAYELQVAWSATSGAQGLESASFAVADGHRVTLSPERVRVNAAYDIWAPTGWDARHVSQYEHAALAAVGRQTRAGGVAYDVGANLGVYTMQLLRSVGESGYVYGFEFNPVCVQLLQATVRGAGYANYSVFPVALGREDGTLVAAINYGSTALGITAASDFFAQKPGHQITVPCVRLDSLVELFRLRPPDFIKIDVEGAEAMVVEGMETTLARHRPGLLLELQGRAAAAATLARLERFRYAIEDVETGRRAVTAEGFLEGLPDKPVQVLCLPA